MENSLHNSDTYDFRQYDRIWQRVAPGLEPYPVMGRSDMTAGEAGGSVPQNSAQTLQDSAQARQEALLPGAAPNPCCMGTAAAEMLDVLTGFVEEELEDQRSYLALCRQAPSRVRQRLRDMAADEGAHARRLMAVYYLITGECYRPVIRFERMNAGSWCAALRERYHAEACDALNYERAAEGTTDPCLRRLLQEMSRDEYRHADMLMTMLEGSLRR